MKKKLSSKSRDKLTYELLQETFTQFIALIATERRGRNRFSLNTAGAKTWRSVVQEDSRFDTFKGWLDENVIDILNNNLLSSPENRTAKSYTYQSVNGKSDKVMNLFKEKHTSSNLGTEKSFFIKN